MKKEMLKGMAKVINNVAAASAGSCSAWILHQPKAPKIVKK